MNKKYIHELKYILVKKYSLERILCNLPSLLDKTEICIKNIFMNKKYIHELKYILVKKYSLERILCNLPSLLD